jgi:hypothetical protein
VDLFAEREGNHGVQTILGNNVIAPGLTKALCFAFTTREPAFGIFDSPFGNRPNNPALPMAYRLKRGNGGADYIRGSDWKKDDKVALTAATSP